MCWLIMCACVYIQHCFLYRYSAAVLRHDKGKTILPSLWVCSLSLMWWDFKSSSRKNTKSIRNICLLAACKNSVLKHSLIYKQMTLFSHFFYWITPKRPRSYCIESVEWITRLICFRSVTFFYVFEKSLMLTKAEFLK